MIQLKIYDSIARLEQFFIDLYETEPIKLTLSIEDITNADATSTYSKAFKVPGTRNNWEFFKNSFDVDGTVFDVTIKKPAEILVDGAEFKIGHIRLQKVFLNTELDRYDYEILFMGETRDFSSTIGDKYLCQLQLNDLIGGVDPNTFTVADAVKSWEAYPQAYVPSTGTPYTPGLTTGLHGGNIIYPLIDHGNTYDDAGLVEQTRIALDGSPSFTQNSNPLTFDRLKPMIRAKRVWDKIFEDAGYTYTSDFIESDLFHQMYISAFGNVATVGWDAGSTSTTSDNIAHGEALVGSWGPVVVADGVVDPGNNMVLFQTFGGTSQYQYSPTTTYTVPTPGTYQISASAWYNGYTENNNYGFPVVVRTSIKLYNITQGQIVTQSFVGNSTTLLFNATLTTGVTPFFSAGDVLCIIVGDLITAPTSYNINTLRFDVLSAPGIFNPTSGLDCTYKQIDFIKDMLTAFRLVLSPDSKNPKNFIVEPWQTYINSGNVHDWSSKLVENKDVQIEPVFFSQSSEIDFKFQPGGDYTNIYHQQAYSEPYGWLEFNSNNELLTGKREIKLVGIAPTELLKVEAAAPTIDFVIPQLHTHSSEDTGLQHKPIKPKTRFLFYNGLNPVGGLDQANHWYLNGSVGNAGPGGQWDVYPLVSSYQAWPVQPQTLNLNWANDIQYWGEEPGYNNIGSTLFSDYWSRYISSLYGKYSRRVTAYFVLNNIDLNSFSFDDTIFVNGTYYIPEKIMDIEIGDYTEVKVQLLTANDYRPAVIPDEVLTLTVTGVAGDCAYGAGSINVVTTGTPGFTWNLSNGVTGFALEGFAPGNEPYNFTISGIIPGTYTLEVIDSLTRSNSVTVIVPVSTATVVTSTSVVVPASDCVGAQDGEISVTPSGGTGPYEIFWPDTAGNSSFNRINLAPGTYEYTILDSLGCGAYSYLVEVPCGGTPAIVYQFQKISNTCSALVNEFAYVALFTEPSLTDTWSLNEFTDCWVYTGVSGGVANATLNQVYVDCESCYGIQPPMNYRVESCTTPGLTHVTTFATQPTIGSVWEITNFTGCWTVIQFSGATPDSDAVTGPFVDCTTCSPPPAPCNLWRSGPYDDQITVYYIDCNGAPAFRQSPCFSTICRLEICAQSITSSTETWSKFGAC